MGTGGPGQYNMVPNMHFLQPNINSMVENSAEFHHVSTERKVKASSDLAFIDLAQKLDTAKNSQIVSKELVRVSQYERATSQDIVETQRINPLS